MSIKFTIKDNEVCILSFPSPKIIETTWADSTLYSVVKREKEKRSKKGHGHTQGDNCPILYAMKQADDLSITEQSVEQLYDYIHRSIDEFFQDNFKFDAVIPMPSKHDVGQKVAHILEKLFNVKIIDDLFVKHSATEATRIAIASKNADERAKQAIKTALGRNGEDKLELKNVPARYRKFVPILKFSEPTPVEMNTINSVLLIDDILSSGSTLNNARKLIKERYPNIQHIDILTVFGPLSKKFLGQIYDMG